jgi:hypothetical protein
LSHSLENIRKDYRIIFEDLNYWYYCRTCGSLIVNHGPGLFNTVGLSAYQPEYIANTEFNIAMVLYMHIVNHGYQPPIVDVK